MAPRAARRWWRILRPGSGGADPRWASRFGTSILVAETQDAVGEEIRLFQADVLDTTPPEVAPVVTGTQAANGFYTTDIGVSWTVTDAESQIISATGCDATTVTTDTTGVTVTCEARSSGGTKRTSVTFKRDATAPALTCPANQSVPATDTRGATVNYPAATASDAIDSSPVITYSQASGSTFAVGTTPVTVTGRDASGNAGTCTFNVTVTNGGPNTPGTGCGCGAGPASSGSVWAVLAMLSLMATHKARRAARRSE